MARKGPKTFEQLAVENGLAEARWYTTPIAKEKMRELYNLRIAKAVDSLEKSPKPPPLFLPIAFLEKKCDPEFADELDIHERIAYQVFHGWDCYPLEVRCHMIEHASMRRE